MTNEATGNPVEDRRRSVPWWSLVAGALALPILYVLSSGPLIFLAVHHTITINTDASGRATAIDHVGVHDWWPNVYAPLVWASGQSWGEPLQSYWQWFMT